MQKSMNKEKACCETCCYYNREVESYGTYHWCMIEGFHIPTTPDDACEDYKRHSKRERQQEHWCC